MMLSLRNNRQRSFLVQTVLLSIILLLALTSVNWQQVRMMGQSTVRNAMASYQRNVAYKDYQWLAGEYIDVVYKEADTQFSQFILETSEESYIILKEKYNYKPSIRPMVIIYPSYGDLLESLGWDEDNKASGVYQAGAIKIVSPQQWYPAEAIGEIKKVYKNFGPIHHEMTHLFVDYIANGNYPDWYTEGLAQLEELNLLGIEWIDENNRNPSELYSFNQLSRGFYRIENQALAYRQSLTMVIYLEQTFGKTTHFEILEELGNGNTFPVALENSSGLTWDKFENEYFKWIHDNWDNFF